MVYLLEQQSYGGLTLPEGREKSATLRGVLPRSAGKKQVSIGAIGHEAVPEHIKRVAAVSPLKAELEYHRILTNAPPD